MEDKTIIFHDNDFENDETLSELWKLIESDENTPQLVNKEKVELTKAIYKMVRNSVDNNDVEVSCKFHSPSKSMGVISISGKNILIKDPFTFSEALDLSGNFEVYTKTDGTVRMDFMIYGLTKIARNKHEKN